MSDFTLSLVDKLSKCSLSNVILKQLSGTLYVLVKVFLVYFALYHQFKTKVFKTLLAKYLNTILHGKLFFFFSFTFTVTLTLLRVYPRKLSEEKPDFPPFSFKLCAFGACFVNINE